MSDYRAELQALIAACEDHYKWMLADKFDGLHQAVQRASAALDGSAMPESWHINRTLSDETLRLLTSLPEEEIQRRLRQPLRPIPVNERLPGDQLCWWFESDEDCGYGSTWTLLRIRGSATGYNHWLPANALPLPEEKQ